jgi:membrane fusion protein (multidrug efflux system)
MHRFAACAFVFLLCLSAGCDPRSQSNGTAPAEGEGRGFSGQVAGKTQPVPGRRGILAPVVQHPVVEVLVALGDHVKKDQPLIKLDADEPEADVRAKKAAVEEFQASVARLKAEPRHHEIEEAEACLENCRITTEASRDVLERLTPLWRNGAIAEQRYHEAKATLARTEADRRASTARLEKLRKRPYEQELAEAQAKVTQATEAVKGAEAELEHYTLTAPIDGVINRLDVNLGAVPWPGRTVWGEILDLREIDVRGDLTPDQADAVAVGQAVRVSRDGKPEKPWAGRVVFVGLAADEGSGKVPVLVRVANPEERLRCGVPVAIRFGTGSR